MVFVYILVHQASNDIQSNMEAKHRKWLLLALAILISVLLLVVIATGNEYIGWVLLCFLLIIVCFLLVVLKKRWDEKKERMHTINTTKLEDHMEAEQETNTPTFTIGGDMEDVDFESDVYNHKPYPSVVLPNTQQQSN
jgi:Ca2+/Na+ antiporter